MLKIRTAKKNDAVPIILVHRDAVFLKGAGYYSQAMLEAWALKPIPESISIIEREIANPDFIVLVAEVENEII